MFNKSVEYAINLLSAMPKVGEVATAKDLSKRGKVPSAYSSKVLQYLRDAGIVTSQRGVGGGVTLTKPANKITILEIVDAVVGGEAPKKGTSSAKIYEEMRKYLSNKVIISEPAKSVVKVKADKPKAKKPVTNSTVAV